MKKRETQSIFRTQTLRLERKPLKWMPFDQGKIKSRHDVEIALKWQSRGAGIFPKRLLRRFGWASAIGNTVAGVFSPKPSVPFNAKAILTGMRTSLRLTRS